MPSQELLHRYARLLTSLGANVQKDQLLYVTAEVYHRDLVRLICEEAYKKGAQCVFVNLYDAVNNKAASGVFAKGTPNVRS